MRGTESAGKLSEFCRRNHGTALRAIVCVFVFWAFLSGGVLFPLKPVVAAAAATGLGMLVAFELSIRDVSQGRVLGSMLLVDLAVGGSYLLWRQMAPPVPVGPLVAADDPTPAGCGDKPKADQLLMAFGTDRVLGKGPGPFTPLLVDDCVALKLFRRDGGLAIQAFGYTYTDDIAFHVIDNVYEPDSALKLRALRPDRSTFMVLDRFDKEVLYVRYLNPHAVRIRGRFLCGPAPQAVVRDDAIWVGGVRINGVFVGQHMAKGHLCAAIRKGSYGVTIKG